jgi:putative FmdB family regulatory protein
MPLYEYECRTCHARLEVIQRFADAPKKRCPDCGGRLAKLISRSGFVLKGGGWYANDYSSAPPSKTGKGEASEGSSSEPPPEKTGDKKDAPAAAKPPDKPSKKKAPAPSSG